MVRVIDEHLALASRHGDTSGFILVRWAQARDDDREALTRPPDAPPHPHWIPLTDVVHHDEAIVLVHRAVPGPTLDTWLRRLHPTPTQLDSIARQLVAAVEAAHRADRVVGALDPRTIWLVKARDAIVPHLVGIGLTEALPDPARFVCDMVEPPFVAPEVRQGGPASVAADRYAVGAVLYRTITGHAPPLEPPYDDPAFEELPERMWDTIDACLHPDPDARPLDVLSAWTRGRAMPTGAWEPWQLSRLARLAPHFAGASLTDADPRPPCPDDPPAAPRDPVRIVFMSVVLGIVAALSAWCSS